jgi:hypothetical protein
MVSPPSSTARTIRIVTTIDPLLPDAGRGPRPCVEEPASAMSNIRFVTSPGLQ